MASLDSFHAYLEGLGHHAGILAEAAVFLSESFRAEADRLSREDGAHRLKAVHAAVVEELEWSRGLESAASGAYTEARLPFEVVGLAAKIIMVATTENRRALNLVSQVCDTSTAKKRPYGTVMVCVGAKSLPDDVRVVSISGLARASNRTESEIIQEQRERGYLLFDQEAFSCLMDRLVTDVREGRLHLPIPIETLTVVETPRLEAKKMEWVRLPRPQ